MDKKVTIKDIARESGVSITTVSRVLNRKEGFYTPETKAKVKEAIKKLEYKPNLVARSLVTKRTNMIGLVIPDISNSFFQELATGIEEFCRKSGFSILLCNTSGIEEREKEYLNYLSQGVVDGIVLTTRNTDEDNSFIEEMAERIPIITIERYMPKESKVQSILVDNIGGIKKVVDLLYENGHRKMAFIEGPQDSSNARFRLEGYKEGLKKHGIPYDPQLVVIGDYKLIKGYEVTKKLLEQDFTSIIASNDLMALGACKAIREAGKKVPEDISVVGFDATLQAELHQPPLESVKISTFEIAKEATKHLIEKIVKGEETGEPIIFKTEIKHGESIKNLYK